MHVSGSTAPRCRASGTTSALRTSMVEKNVSGLDKDHSRYFFSYFLICSYNLLYA